MSLPNNFLSSVASFVKLALDNSEQLQDDIISLKKEAAVAEINKEKYRLALNKAADVLYDADYLTDEHEKRVFIRKCAEDPVYAIRFLEKVASANDVAQIGRPAKVASRKDDDMMNDPVYIKAFGLSHNSSIIDD